MVPNCEDDLDAVQKLRDDAASPTLATEARVPALRCVPAPRPPPPRPGGISRRTAPPSGHPGPPRPPRPSPRRPARRAPRGPRPEPAGPPGDAGLPPPQGARGPRPGPAPSRRKWFRALCNLEVRFPFSPEGVEVSFAWDDAFQPTQRQTSSSLHLEKAAVLFNLGAAYARLACDGDRKTAPGLSQAAQSLQHSAACFAHLRDHVGVKLDAASRPEDIGPESCTLLERVALAHAQQMCYESALLGGKGPALLARVARHCAALFAEAEGLAGDAGTPLGRHLPRGTRAHLQCKARTFEALTELHQAAVDREADDNGREVSRTRRALDLCGDAGRALKQLSPPDPKLEAALRLVRDDVQHRLARCEKENRAVYLCRVPPHGDLPAVAPAPLVRASPAAAVLAAPAGQADAVLFSSVVPEDLAKSLSRFTDLLERAVREQMAALEGTSEEALVSMRLWELPEALGALDGPSEAALPEGLRREVARVQSMGGLAALRGLSEQVDDMKQVCASEVEKLDGLLAREAEDDERLRARFGAGWKRARSASLSGPYRGSLDRLRGHLATAGRTDAQVRESLDGRAGAFGALTPGALASRLPRLEPPMVTVGEVEPAEAAARVRGLILDAERLANERAALEARVRAVRDAADVGGRLGGGADVDEDALFAEELAKLDPVRDAVAENASRTRRVMAELEAAQRAFREAFQYDAWRAACEAVAQGALEDAAAYQTTYSNLEAGLRFYLQAQDELQSVGQQVRDFLLSRQTERDDLVAGLQAGGGGGPGGPPIPQFAGLSVADSPGQAAPQPPQPSQGFAPGAPPPPPPPPPAGPYGGGGYGAPPPAGHAGGYHGAPPPPHGGHPGHGAAGAPAYGGAYGQPQVPGGYGQQHPPPPPPGPGHPQHPPPPYGY